MRIYDDNDMDAPDMSSAKGKLDALVEELKAAGVSKVSGDGSGVFREFLCLLRVACFASCGRLGSCMLRVYLCFPCFPCLGYFVV